MVMARTERELLNSLPTASFASSGKPSQAA